MAVGYFPIVPITTHRELQVFQRSFRAAMQIFELTKSFPKEERYSLTDQVRRSSRSVAANITEAWRKRRYEGAFVLKLSDAETEAAETQTWLEFAAECGYVSRETVAPLLDEYDQLIRILVDMIHNSHKWCLPPKN